MAYRIDLNGGDNLDSGTGGGLDGGATRAEPDTFTFSARPLIGDRALFLPPATETGAFHLAHHYSTQPFFGGPVAHTEASLAAETHFVPAETAHPAAPLGGTPGNFGMSDEVAFIAGVYADGTLPLYAFSAWNNDTPATYTGGFTDTAKWGTPTAGTGGGTIKYFFNPASNWNTTEEQFLSAGLALWSDVANISFAPTASAAQAQIVFTRGSDGGAATSPTTSSTNGAGVTGGSVLLTMTKATVSIDTSVAGFGPINGSFTTDGGYPIMTFLHEEGHAIGLGHGGPYNGDVNEATQQFSAYDTRLWSIMSYIEPRTTTAQYFGQYPVTGTNWGIVNGFHADPTGLMPLDILAAQQLYGAPTTTPLSGGQIFGFNSNIAGPSGMFFDFTQNTHPILTIWDSGTSNVLDLSGFSADSTVNLNPGTFSSCDGMVNNLAVAFNTSLDTLALGGGTNSAIANNDGDIIDGGAGNDTITGGTGEDELIGNGGADHISGGAGDDRVTDAGVGSTLDGGANNDLLELDRHTATQAVNFTFTPGSATPTALFDGTTFVNFEHLTLSTGSGNDIVTFVEPIHDADWGGNNWDGGAGTDTAIVDLSASASSISTADLGAGFIGVNSLSQTLLRLTNVENLNIAGSAFGDQLTGFTGNDVLRGNGGNDTLNGGAGSDTAVFSGARANYQFHDLGGGVLQVVDMRAGSPDGTDTIQNIEFATFSDGTVAVGTLGGSAAPVIGATATTAPVVSMALVSTTSTGAQGNNDSTYDFPVFSHDGTKLVFTTIATNLGQDSAVGVENIYVKNLTTGAVTLGSYGTFNLSGDGDSFGGSLSQDGTKLLFVSFANNLVAGDNNNHADVFVKDLVSGNVTLVSTDSSGAQFASTDAVDAAFSADGTKVVLTEANQVYVKTLSTGALTLVSSDASGVPGSGTSSGGQFSPDGTKVAFTSNSTSLGGNPVNTVYLKDLTTGAITRVSTDANGFDLGHNGTQFDGFSPDGTKMLIETGFSSSGGVFTSSIYLKDLVTGAATLVSTNASGVAGDKVNFNARFSPDGSKIVFASTSDNLVAGDTNNTYDIFEKDLNTGAVTLVSQTALGGQADFVSLSPTFSSDGSKIAFVSYADSLAAGDANNTGDVFVASLGYVAKAAPVAIAGGLTLSDSDSTALAGATVTISGGFQSGDTLSASTAGTGISATYNATTHVLTLSGSDTIAHYQSVLRSVAFSNPTNNDPAASATRTFTWVANDGTSPSTAATTTINVVDTATGTHTGNVTITGTVAVGSTLTANTSALADPNGIGTLHYTWVREDGFSTVVGADQPTYAPVQADSGFKIYLEVTYTDGHGNAELVTAQTTTTVFADNPPTGSVTITGSLVDGQVLTANTDTLSDADGVGTLHYQWQHSTNTGFVNVGTDSATYTLQDADVGTFVRVIVSYTDGHGTAESLTSANSSSTVSTVNHAPTGAVTISGTAVENQVLSAITTTIADADGLGTFHYQWQRDTGSGFVNVGFNQATYTLDDPDVGGHIRVIVSYTDGHGTVESLTSGQTATVVNVNDPPTGAPTISGTVAEFQTITAVTTGISDADGLGTFHYQWQRDSGSGFINVGTDQATYALTNTDLGAHMRVVVSYTDGHGTPESVTSTQTAAVAFTDSPPTGTVTITGGNSQNQPLTANTSTLADVDGLGTFHYQWQAGANGQFANVGTDQATYTPTQQNIGLNVRVIVSYTDGHGDVNSVTSAPTAAILNVDDPPTGSVVIHGTVTENQVLTADASGVSDLDGFGGVFFYQWQRDSGSGFVNVGFNSNNATTYTLGNADVGAHIRVVVSYTDGFGAHDSIASAPTAAVVNINDPPQGAVEILGTPTESNVLTLFNGISDADGLGQFHYQWQRSNGGSFINVGTDQATYTLTHADAGAQMRVIVSYVDGHGTSEFVVSAETDVVASLDTRPTGAVTISGTATEDQTLTAVTTTIADADGLGTFHYQWMRTSNGGSFNVGTDQATYTLGDADVGAQISVTVTYIDGRGVSEILASTATGSVVNVNDPPVGRIVIAGLTAGSPIESQVLTAQTDQISDGDGLGTFHYQWQRDTGGGVFVNIGTDSVTYTPTNADVGFAIRATATYVDGHGTTETVTSPETGATVNVNDHPTGAVTISGTVTENQVLTAVTTTIADADGLGTFHYQWQRDSGGGFVNVGTNQATYTLGNADDGAHMRVVVSYTDGHGTVESLTSGQTAAVVSINDAPILAGAGNTVGYTEQQVAPLAIDSGLTVSDADNATLAGATVKIAAGFVAGDILGFVNQAGITGSYNAATHILTLTGAASLAAYQTALRSVTFSNSGDNPDNFHANTTRAIAWQVDDGQSANHASAAVISTIAVTAIDDPAVAHNDAFAITAAYAAGNGLSLFADNGSGADSDPDNVLHVTAVNGVAGNVGNQITLASGALLTVNADGSFTFDPNHVYDSLAAAGSGATDVSATETFTVAVNGITETVTVNVAGADDNDTLLGTHGNDTFDGGAGIDTLVLTGNQANYSIVWNPTTQAYTVTDNRGGSPDGTDTVRGVENFHFADGTFSYATAVTVSGSTTTTYDAANDHNWASRAVTVDAQGSLATQTIVTDGGSKWVNTYDTTNAGANLWKSDSYDASGHLLLESGTNDDGTHFLTLNDVANTYRWTTATVAFDANWNVTGVTGTNDDSTHTVTMANVQSAYDTALWFTTPYDADHNAAPENLSLTGGGNADQLYGHAGNDTLNGAGGNDYLNGGTGNDTLTGGAGDDRFYFKSGDGLDTVTDFVAGNASGDVIELHGYGVTSFAALQPFMSQSGADTVIAFDDQNHIVLHNVTLAQLNSGDFLFS